MNQCSQRLKLALSLIFTFSICSCSYAADNSEFNRLIFDQPAPDWHEAIPIGNGSLGGMVYGGLQSDTIKINEETLWSGEPRDLQNYDGIKHLPEIRKLLLEDRTMEAQALIDSTMLGPYNECYLPMGDLVLNTLISNVVEDYSRSLDLNTGIVTVKYTKDGTEFERQTFASYPDKAIIIRLSANKSKSISFAVSLHSKLKYTSTVEGNTIILKGQAPLHAYPHYQGKMDPVYEKDRGMAFQMRLLIRNRGGMINQQGSSYKIKNADEVELILTAATSFNGFDKNPVSEGRNSWLICKQRIENIEDLDFQQLKQRHVEDYSELFSRVNLELGQSDNQNLPIDKRIEKYKAGEDPGLVALYFQFGRYLLISSSRQGEFAQPANLQGIWSRSLQPAWSANWTLNCNAQINYWPAEVANLSECHLPLLEMTKELSVDGARTAKNLYGCRGWIAHHNADIWRTTSPVGGTGLWAIYQVGSAWLCHHIWEHYEYTLDRDFLKAYYPIMKDAAIFYIDNLQRDKEGFLVTSPSESFENHFKKPDGTVGWACMGSTQDMQIIRDLFQNCRKATEVLMVDMDFSNALDKYLVQLLPMRISPRTGRLQEWKDDWEASTPQGGQVAHGWGLAVGNQITPRGTPELASAFRKTLEYRKPWDASNCGSWVGSFAAKFWVRLGDGNMAQKVVDKHIQNAIFPNFTSSFFDDFWEIDGNLGITASIAEMLLQSHAGAIELLPALPDSYPSGEVSGLCARGGFVLDIKWKDGHLTGTTIKAKNDGICTLKYNNYIAEIIMKQGEEIMLDEHLESGE